MIHFSRKTRYLWDNLYFKKEQCLSFVLFFFTKCRFKKGKINLRYCLKIVFCFHWDFSYKSSFLQVLQQDLKCFKQMWHIFFTFHFFLMIGKIYISRDIYDLAWTLGSSMKRVKHFVYHVWNYVSFWLH